MSYAMVVAWAFLHRSSASAGASMAGLRILFDTPKRLPKQIIGARNQQRWLTCWSVSILLHAGLFLLGTVWLIHSAYFHVIAGKTSTEINLILEPVPVSVTTPSSPVPVSSPSVQTAQAPEPTKPEIKALPEPVTTSSTIVKAKPPPLKPPAAQKAVSSNETKTSGAIQGAVQAEPDDLHNEPPEYPEESRASREQGTVIFRVEVTATGEPADVSILKNSGYFRLDQAARHAVQHWKFHPAITAGISVSSEAEVPIHFKLQ
jgi:protein TonB